MGGDEEAGQRGGGKGYAGASSLCGLAANADTPGCGDCDRAGQCLQIVACQYFCEQFDCWPYSVFAGPQQDYSAMTSRRMPSHISESLVSGDKQSLFGLDDIPQGVILRAAQMLLQHIHGIMPAFSQQLYRLLRQVFVYLYTHSGAPHALRGSITSSRITSAAYARAALMSSGVSWG